MVKLLVTIMKTSKRKIKISVNSFKIVKILIRIETKCVKYNFSCVCYSVDKHKHKKLFFKSWKDVYIEKNKTTFWTL